MVIEHADFDGIERLSAVLGSDILSTFDNPEKEGALGVCGSIEEIMIGEDKVLKFNGCARNEAYSIVLRESGAHILDEADRSLHDAICVLVATVENLKATCDLAEQSLQDALDKIDELEEDDFRVAKSIIRVFG